MKHDAYFTSPYKYIGIVEKSYMSKSEGTLTIDPETGEAYSLTKLSSNKTVMHDELIYTKLFQDSVHSLCGLGNSSLRIMLYVAATARPLAEIIVLNAPDVMIFCNISKSSFYDGIIELLDKKVLCRKLGSSIEFWFDPNIMFNGNRVKASDNYYKNK